MITFRCETRHDRLKGGKCGVSAFWSLCHVMMAVRSSQGGSHEAVYDFSFLEPNLLYIKSYIKLETITFEPLLQGIWNAASVSFSFFVLPQILAKIVIAEWFFLRKGIFLGELWLYFQGFCIFPKRHGYFQTIFFNEHDTRRFNCKVFFFDSIFFRPSSNTCHNISQLIMCWNRGNSSWRWHCSKLFVCGTNPKILRKIFKKSICFINIKSILLKDMGLAVCGHWKT